MSTAEVELEHLTQTREKGESSEEKKYETAEEKTGGGLEWKDVAFTVYNSREGPLKQILFGVSGRLRKGEFLGVLGGSGAGKSTLLNILSGRLLSTNLGAKDSWLSKKARIASTEVSGAVAYEKAAFDLGDSDAIKGISAYVMQSDILCPVHTPKEALTFSAKLRLPQSVSSADKQQRVAAVMDALKITKCQNTLIGDEEMRGISGGERKRTSVGVELVTDPNVVFLDEPTSGLDSFTAQKTVDRLRTLCADGRVVIATLHQPSAEIFLALDKLLLLAKGHCVYFGPPKDACAFFEAQGEGHCGVHSNPAEFVLDAIQRSPQKFIDAWKLEEKRQFAQYPLDFECYDKLEPKSQIATGFLFQAGVLLKREWAIYTRNLSPMKMRLIQTIVFGVLMGFLYWNLPHDQQGLRDRFGWVFFLSNTSMILGVIATLGSFPEQRLLLERERNNNMYSTLPYFWTKTCLQVAEAAAFSLVSAIINYFMVGADSQFWQVFLVVFLMANGGAAMGVLMSCFAANLGEAMAFVPIVLMPQMLMANFLVSLDQVPVFLRWLQYLVMLRYSVDALAITEFRGEDYDLEDGQGFDTGDDYLDSIGTDKSDLVFDYLMLLALTVGFRALTYFVLVKRIGW